MNRAQANAGVSIARAFGFSAWVAARDSFSGRMDYSRQYGIAVFHERHGETPARIDYTWRISG